jgi:hypothetical protein
MIIANKFESRVGVSANNQSLNEAHRDLKPEYFEYEEHILQHYEERQQHQHVFQQESARTVIRLFAFDLLHLEEFFMPDVQGEVAAKEHDLADLRHNDQIERREAQLEKGYL